MMVVEMNEMWIRQDWLDKLGLEVPRTWDEMAAVAEAFVTQDPDCLLYTSKLMTNIIIHRESIKEIFMKLL